MEGGRVSANDERFLIMNFRKLALLLLVVSSTVQAKEEWGGEFTPPNKSNISRGHRSDIAITVLASIDRSPDGSLEGTISMTGHQLRCHGEAKIESGRIKGGSIEIKTELLPIHNCGRFVFKGAVSEDSWIGDVPWNGVSNGLTFKRLK